MVPLLPLRDGVRALPISSFRQSMPSFYMNAPDCICSPGRLPLGAFCAGRDGRFGQDWPTRCAFQSTPPVWGATARRALDREKRVISIHVPHVGRDAEVPDGLPGKAISIHAPHVGRDLGRMMQNMDDMQFQSTHPVRGATTISWLTPRSQMFQSTHPVRGATVMPGKGSLDM